MKYQVTKAGEFEIVNRYPLFALARKYADEQRKATGGHYEVERVETVYTTKSLDEAIKESGVEK